MNPKKLKIIIAVMAICIAFLAYKFNEANSDLKKYTPINKLKEKTIISCSCVKLIEIRKSFTQLICFRLSGETITLSTGRIIAIPNASKIIPINIKIAIIMKD